MEEKREKRFTLMKSGAFMISVLIHAVILVVALSFVAVKVYIKPEQTFETKVVKRPHLKLRKLQLPVKAGKKTPPPKLRQNIVAKPKLRNVAIKMPEIIGVSGGTFGSGEGLGGLGFNFDLDLFGSSGGTGDELIGVFYDIKQEPDGDLTEIGEMAEKDPHNIEYQRAACRIIRGYISSGFNEGRMKGFFKAPKLKYATTIMMPPMSADSAPTAFDVENQVKGSYWVCHYKGQIAAPESGRYRFCGLGDDIVIVRIGRKIVLDATWPQLYGQLTDWRSRDDNSRKFQLNGYLYGPCDNYAEIYDQLDRIGAFKEVFWHDALGQVRIDDEPLHADYMQLSSRLVIGDWIELRKGQAVDIDILIGEVPGGTFFARLLVEQEGKSYTMVESDAGLRPVLPIFKTKPVDETLVSQMQLDPNEMTLDGPVFGAHVNASR